MRGVQPLAVVSAFQKVSDAAPGFGKIAILHAIDFFGLECFYEALGFRVVAEIAFAAQLIPTPWSFSCCV